MKPNKLVGAKARAKREGWLKWIRSEGDEAAIRNGCYFDIAAAEHVIEFFAKFLCFSKGRSAGKPFELADWQRDDIFMPMFGWMNAEDLRRFRRAYIEIPKKNGKSTMASGVGIYMLCGDGEPGAEVYSTGTDKNSAKIVHNEAINMVEASEALRDALSVNRSTGQISYPATKSFYRVLSSDPHSNEGFNSHCIVKDEVHEWRGRGLWDALRDAGAARDQPLDFSITTAGNDTTSVCWELHQYADRLLKGQDFDERFFPYIRAAGPKDDWLDPKTWAKANPSLNVTIKLSDFKADVKEVSRQPSQIPGFKRRRLNLWQSGASPWISPHDWDACTVKFDRKEMRGDRCIASLDLSRTRDTTALVLAFDRGEEKVRFLPFFFLPRETAEAQRDDVPYLRWAQEGLIELTDGKVIDYGVIEHRFRQLAEEFSIEELTFDPKFAEEITQRLSEGQTDADGKLIVPGTGVPRCGFGQTIVNFAAPTAEFERRVIAGLIEHNGHPLFAWQIGNAQVHTDANGNMRPVKPSKNDRRKIDGAVCAIMGLGRLMFKEPEFISSVYDTPGGGVAYIDY